MNPTVPEQTETAAEIQQVEVTVRRRRLDFIDGLRGLAALYIAFGHSFAGVHHQNAGIPVPAWFIKAFLYTAFERFAVCLFIVISGFCLMLPVLRKGGNGQVPGGIMDYLYKRSRRILPPYYASFILTILAISLAGWYLLPPGDSLGEEMKKGFTVASVVSHLFMVQNWSPEWAFKINPPTWTVATEYQIYFLFPMVLLPAWRWLGYVGALVAALLIGVMIPFNAEPYGAWFPALFVLGMGAAACCYGPETSAWRGERSAFASRVVRQLPWGSVAVVFFGIMIAAKNHWTGWLYKGDSPFFRGVWLRYDMIAGMAAFGLIMYCAVRSMRHEDGERTNWMLRFLEWRPVVWLGTFSYSLYLMHSAVLMLVYAVVRPMGFSPLVQLGCMWGIAVPSAVLISYGFHVIFERPYMNHPPASNKQEGLNHDAAECPRTTDNEGAVTAQASNPAGG